MTLSITAVLVPCAVSAEARPLHVSAQLQCRNFSPALQRCEGDFFICWIPTRWLAYESANTLEITSPTGVLYVGYAFSQWPRPLTFPEVRGVIVRLGGLDKHPLRGLRFTSRGRPFPARAWERQISTWTARRTDRRERVRGVLTIDLLNDYATDTYADQAYTRVAPVTLWQKWARTLLFIQKAITRKS